MATYRRSRRAIRNVRSREYVKAQKRAVAAPYLIVAYARGWKPWVRT